MARREFLRFVYPRELEEVGSVIDELLKHEKGTVSVTVGLERDPLEKIVDRLEDVLEVAEAKGFPVKGFKSFAKRFASFCVAIGRNRSKVVLSLEKDGDRKYVVVSCKPEHGIRLQVEPRGSRRVALVSEGNELEVDRVARLWFFDNTTENSVHVREMKRGALNKKFVVRASGRAANISVSFDGKSKAIDIDFGMTMYEL